MNRWLSFDDTYSYDKDPQVVVSSEDGAQKSRPLELERDSISIRFRG